MAQRVKLSLKNRLAQRLLLNMRPASFASVLKGLIGVERVVVETGAGRFYLDPVSHFGALLIGGGEHDPGISRTLEYFLRSGDTFVDIGANEGYFSVVGAKLVGSTGTVVAAEPQARLKPVLVKNFQLNGIEYVKLVDCAISDQSGTNELYISPDLSTGSTGFYRRTKYKVPVQTVETITLAELFRRSRIDCAHVLKMDIEGFEYEAILGSQELFVEKRIKVLALDLHPDYLEKRGQGVEKILEFLAKCDYSLDHRFENTVWTVDARA
jgi:FkbM family methyltransferase